MRSEKKRSLVLLKSAAQEKQPAPQVISVPAHSALGNWQLATGNWQLATGPPYKPYRSTSTVRNEFTLHCHTAALSYRCTVTPLPKTGSHCDNQPTKSRESFAHDRDQQTQSKPAYRSAPQPHERIPEPLEEAPQTYGTQ